MIQINQKQYSKPLFVFALESEAGSDFQHFNKIFTGVGKFNASYRLMKALETQQPDIIINLGTAGSPVFDRGQVVCCGHFIQRDMDVQALGFDKFQTPFENTNGVLRYGVELHDLPIGICGSGDQFETEHCHPEYNVIDMEAFVLSRICQLESIDFLCLKYISDGADGNAVDDWNLEVKKASKALFQALGCYI